MTAAPHLRERKGTQYFLFRKKIPKKIQFG